MVLDEGLEFKGKVIEKYELMIKRIKESVNCRESHSISTIAALRMVINDLKGIEGLKELKE